MIDLGEDAFSSSQYHYATLHNSVHLMISREIKCSCFISCYSVNSMENFQNTRQYLLMKEPQKHKTTVTPQQMMFQLKHKLASMLTEQKMEAMEQQKLAEQNKTDTVQKNTEKVEPT